MDDCNEIYIRSLKSDFEESLKDGNIELAKSFVDELEKIALDLLDQVNDKDKL